MPGPPSGRTMIQRPEKEHSVMTELSQSSVGELDRTLAESGIAPGDVKRLMKAHPGTARQLAAMMRRQGIDPAALPRRSALRDMEWQCGACGDWRQCRAWLAAPE